MNTGFMYLFILYTNVSICVTYLKIIYLGVRDKTSHAVCPFRFFNSLQTKLI